MQATKSAWGTKRVLYYLALGSDRRLSYQTTIFREIAFAFEPFEKKSVLEIAGLLQKPQPKFLSWQKKCLRFNAVNQPAC